MKVLVTESTYRVGMAVMRSLRRSGWTVRGVDTRRAPWGLRAPFTKPCRVLPPPGEDRYVESLLDILEQERPDVFLPLMLNEQIVRRQEEIARRTAIIVPPLDPYLTALDNGATAHACRAFGIPAARLLTIEEAKSHFEHTTAAGDPTPLVVKPRRDVGAARGVSVVSDALAAEAAVQAVEAAYGPAIIQEFIPGPPTSMRTVNLIFDRESRLAAFFTTRKIRQFPNRGGLSALSESTCDRELVAAVLPLFQAWRWRGPVEVEIKIDARTGAPTVIEINPRFWGYLAFPMQCGVDFPLIACETALGQRSAAARPPRYQSGIRYLDPLLYPCAVAEELRSSGRLVHMARTVLRELRGAKVGMGLGVGSGAAATAIMALCFLRKRLPFMPR